MSLLAISMTYCASNKNRIIKSNRSEFNESYRYDECRVKPTLTHNTISPPSNGMLNASQELSIFPFQIKRHGRCNLHTCSRHCKCILQTFTMDFLETQGNRHTRNTKTYTVTNSCRCPCKSLERVFCEENNNFGKYYPTSPAPFQMFMSNNQVQDGNKKKHVLQYQLTVPKLLGIVI